MKTNFSPVLQYSWVAAGVAVGSAVYGIVKSSKAKKAQRKMEALANQQKPDQGITDYYKEALKRYNTNPYQSQFYQNAKLNADRNLATGIGALQSRRSAVGGVSALLGQTNNALRQAGVGAEQLQNQAFGQLGQSVGANAQEQKYPMEMKYNLYGAQAAGYNQAANTAFQSAYNGLGSFGAQSMGKWGSGRSSNTGGGSSYNYLNYGMGE